VPGDEGNRLANKVLVPKLPSSPKREHIRASGIDILSSLGIRQFVNKGVSPYPPIASRMMSTNDPASRSVTSSAGPSTMTLQICSVPE